MNPKGWQCFTQVWQDRICLRAIAVTMSIIRKMDLKPRQAKTKKSKK
jgi:hypothetical protein